ncbi:hypothetical protein L226DRAFT_531671 [Lentinus tigrinus ALCF2SS1-7]|uniref:uncharacterized protein n=1 Tax=Lentinus tigrinus ALCF2SS1-7 TaxID=1328758 RepID=UPI00116615FF|nr:hypothetical protein L226DRAFT_535976 [Lentinus tigrinus ALCF2SS1-7]RPD78324.1 hypothetical protein L226DRAFT_531671 [Lentinus tigrinus ALCF2SS1-7]
MKSALSNKRDKFQALVEAVTQYVEHPLQALMILEMIGGEGEDDIEVDENGTELL